MMCSWPRSCGSFGKGSWCIQCLLNTGISYLLLVTWSRRVCHDLFLSVALCSLPCSLMITRWFFLSASVWKIGSVVFACCSVHAFHVYSSKKTFTGVSLTCLCTKCCCLCMDMVNSQVLAMVRRHLSSFSFGGVSLPVLKICGNNEICEGFEEMGWHALYEEVLVENGLCSVDS